MSSVGVAVTVAVGCPVELGVAVGPSGVSVLVGVMVGVSVGPPGVAVFLGVEVGVAVGPSGVSVLVAVDVGVGLGVSVGVDGHGPWERLNCPLHSSQHISAHAPTTTEPGVDGVL